MAKLTLHLVAVLIVFGVMGEGVCLAATPAWATGGAFIVDEGLHVATREWIEDRPLLRDAGELLEVIGGPYGIAAATTAIWMADQEAGWRAVRAVATTAAITVALKKLTQRDRPPGAQVRYQFPGRRDSFPSGHASLSFALATVAGDAFPRWKEEAFAAAAMIALSRVVVGRHWASDVVAGAWLGYYVATITSAGAPIGSLQWSF